MVRVMVRVRVMVIIRLVIMVRVSVNYSELSKMTEGEISGVKFVLCNLCSIKHKTSTTGLLCA